VLPWKDLAHVLLIASAALIPASLPQLLQDAPILLRLVLSGGLYVLTYYVLLLGIGPLQLDERLLLKSYMRSALLRLQRGVVKATA